MSAWTDPDAPATKTFVLKIPSKTPPKAPQYLQGYYKKEFTKQVKNALSRAGRSNVKLLKTRSRRVEYKGRYREGWKYKATSKELVLWNKEEHAIFVEMGRKPGSKQPPARPIYEWMLAKGFVNVTFASALFLAAKIGKRGILPRRVMTDPMTRADMLIEVWRQLDKAADAAAKSLALVMSKV